MPGFALAPADGGCPLALPPGQTVLGRGPCWELPIREYPENMPYWKWWVTSFASNRGDSLANVAVLSKSNMASVHAVVKCWGLLHFFIVRTAAVALIAHPFLTKIHVNPCFYQSPENNCLLPLETDEWHSLSPGDSFSLLIDKYTFKIISTHSDVENTLRKNSKIVDETANKSSSMSHLTKMSCDPSSVQLTSCSNNNVKVHSLLERTAEIPKETSSKSSLFSANYNKSEEREPEWRKRILPSWMLQGDLMVQSLSTPVTNKGGGVTRGRGRGISSMKPSKSRADMHGRKRLASEECLGDFKEMEQDQGKKSKTTEEETTVPKQGKNPVHFQEFSHPGDSDYHDMEVVSQNDDDRPECPYGTTCYRKNPQHKLEYKHTATPETETRTTRQKTTKRGKSILEEDSDNDGEPNEYDLNDSFLDDEEKEEEYDPTDEDSDWEPDPEDKDNEDVATLLKEAQKFIKTKK